MNLEDGKRAAWTRAVEEAGSSIAEETSIAASRKHLPESDLEFLAGRAKELTTITGDLPEGKTVPWGKFVPTVLGLALLVGLLSDLLDGVKIINVLNLSLLGIVAWNFAIYLWMLVAKCLGQPWRPAWLDSLFARWTAQKDADAVHRKYLKLWSPWILDPAAGRVRAILHTGAAVLALGLIAGMYCRGLGKEFHAVWESTFLESTTVRSVLEVLLAPGQFVTGLDIPELSKNEGEKMDAEQWIHLFAGTIAVCVIVPRLLLAGIAFIRARRSEGTVSLKENGWPEYITGLRDAAHIPEGPEAEEAREEAEPTKSTVVQVISAGVVPEGKVREAVRRFVSDTWSGKKLVDFLEPVEYGGEDEFVEELSEGARETLFLFPLSTTPEEEIQGFLVEELKKRCGGEGVNHIVLLEGGGFYDRLGGLPEFERRWTERQAAWRRVLAKQGAEMFTLLPGQRKEWEPLQSPDV